MKFIMFVISFLAFLAPSYGAYKVSTDRSTVEIIAPAPKKSVKKATMVSAVVEAKIAQITATEEEKRTKIEVLTPTTAEVTFHYGTLVGAYRLERSSDLMTGVFQPGNSTIIVSTRVDEVGQTIIWTVYTTTPARFFRVMPR